MLGLLRFFRGTVLFEVQGGYVERFLSQCAAAGLTLYHPRRTADGLTAAAALPHKALLRQVAAKSGVSLRIVREQGVPATVGRYRLRAGVFAGLALMLLVPVILSMFIWRVEIVGNIMVPTGQLRDSLRELGVRTGALRRTLSAREIERGLLIANEDIRWVGVNLRGSRAVVEVRERESVALPMDTSTPTNVVAAKGGYITRMDVYEGTPTVKNGDSVVAGDLLVSGIMENKKEESRTVHARAKVLAQVEESLAVTIPYEREVYGYRGYATHRTLRLGGLRLPLGGDEVPEQPWKLETATEPLRLGGLRLPLTVERQNYLLLETATEHLTPTEARLEAEAQLRRLEARSFSPDSIVSRELTGQEFEDKFILFADYTRVCDIAEEREILLGQAKETESMVK